MSPTTAIVWWALADWQSEVDMNRQLRRRYPTVPSDELRLGLVKTLGMLLEMGLVERIDR